MVPGIAPQEASTRLQISQVRHESSLEQSVLTQFLTLKLFLETELHVIQSTTGITQIVFIPYSLCFACIFTNILFFGYVC